MICDTTKDEFIMEAIRFTLKTQAMYTMQHVHSTAQVAVAYRQAHSISDDDMEGFAFEI
jgi:hypothetical protein